MDAFDLGPVDDAAIKRRATCSGVFSWSLRLVLRRMRQWPFVLEHLAKIAAVDPAAAGRAADEVLRVALWLNGPDASRGICRAER